MSPWFVRAIVTLGRGVLRLCSRGRVEGAEHVPAEGGVLLTANHTHFFDSGLIIGACPRYVRWVSILDVENGPHRWFLRRMGLIAFQRGGRDAHAMRRIVECLQAGDVVGLFPEGGIRSGAESITGGAALDTRFCRLADIAGAPVVPCICLGAEQFGRLRTWLPFSGARWSVVFGPPILPGPEQGAAVSAAIPGLYRRALELLA